MQNTLLQINNVSKFYKDKVALKDVSIAVPKGHIYGLLGPNGAGKTTLIRIINQITEADEGSVMLNGEPLNQTHIRNIGYLPEERGLYKKIKVIRQLEYFAQLRGMTSKEATQKATEWLKAMELYDVRNKKIEELSKGMQQKIQFIVSVIHSPSLLILDEPFSGFDPVNAELLTQKILELKAAGTTILYSTHRMESVEKLCDSMALIHQAEKILDGTVAEIKNKFKSDLFEIVTSGNYAPSIGAIEIMQQSTTDAGHPSLLLKLNGVSNNACLKDVMNQTELIHFSQKIPSINDIFIQLVTPHNN
ncbi:MAG: ATP-binding cassette domain-containing protein [bacterium]|nr:ATP-binding cassette domain-containing protein [bacterium]